MATKKTHEKTAQDLLLVGKKEGVTTLTMNEAGRPMMDALTAAFAAAAQDDETRVLVLTGVDPYFCAGVNLSGAFQLEHPRKMHATIVKNNEALFNMFLDFPEPILIAVNGPAIGASVTSATLCDGMIASENATFSTPFAALGVTPEGCSSVHFARLMGEENAERMLGREGWRPTAEEALDAGLIQWVVPHDQLGDEARRIALEWIETDAQRSFRGGSKRDELKAVNARESVDLADAFLSPAFIKAQFKFLSSKKKWGPAAVFLGMLISRPIWSRMI